ncbi:MAG TPA: hypothetical protein VMC09_11365 [Anaerolineales bacterium]|nr:hypothetical protein [Anaerolineales bacterium]
MIQKLEKAWPYISILLILALVAALFFWQPAARGMAYLLVGLSVLAALAFLVFKPVQAYRAGRLSRPAMRRAILVDGLGLLLSLAAVILAAGKLAGLVARAAGNAWGATAGTLSALTAALVAGLAVGLPVRWAWGALTRPRRPGTAGDPSEPHPS